MAQGYQEMHRCLSLFGRVDYFSRLGCEERLWATTLNTDRAIGFGTHTNNAIAGRQIFIFSWDDNLQCHFILRMPKILLIFVRTVFCKSTNSHSNTPMGPSLFVERISWRHQSKCTVHQFGLTLNPHTRVGVHSKAPFDEQSRAHKRSRQCH